jgi:alpha-mannosidase
MRRILAASLLLLSLPSFSQTSARKPAQGPPPVPLTPAAANVLNTLDSLAALPLGEWRYHSGDMTHGEDTSLDDSSWQLVKAPFTAPNDAVWFRQTVTVPATLHGYDLTGATVWFHFSVDANGPVPLIIYFNGRRVALGEDLEPIVLFDKLKPGDRAVIAVKVLHTVDTKRFSGAEATVQFADNRPNPLLFATEARSAQVLLPSLQPDNATAPAALNKAIEDVSLTALDAANQQKFDASLTLATQHLADLRPLLQQALIRMAGNSHIDAAWLWPESETIDVVRRTFATALQLMQEYPAYTFTQSAAQYSEWIEQKYPDEFRQIKDEVNAHRWELVGGMWVEPDLNMPAGESLVRQMLVGKDYFKQKFGVDVTVGWNPDSFGYNFQLPQIYKKSGVDYFVTQKMWWNDTNPLPLKLFWWQGLDGSRVLTYFPHDYVNGIEPLKIARDFAAARTLNPGTDEMLHLYGIGDHGGGPTRAMLDEAAQWMTPAVQKDTLPRAPVLTYAYAETFFHEVEKKLDTEHSPVWNYKTLAAADDHPVLPTPPAGKFALPIWNDELYLEYHRGVFTTQAKHKQNMRESEDWLTNAEKWSSLAWLGGAAYPHDKLEEAWKLELFNQFHDLAAGSGIAVIYKDAQKDYDVVHWTAQDATRSALQNIQAKVSTDVPTRFSKDSAPIMVYNPLPWPVTEVVSLPVENQDAPQVRSPGGTYDTSMTECKPNCKLSFLAENVPAAGYKVYYAAKAHRNLPAVQATRTLTLDNGTLSLQIDEKTGCITHLVDIATHFDSIDPGKCGNELQTFVDTPREYDAWNIDPGTLDHHTTVSAVDAIEPATAQNKFVQQVTIHRHFGKSTITQQIILYAGLPYVVIKTDVDWHETHVLLKAAFPLNIQSDHATYEIPYGAIERPTTRDNSFEKARFEVPALRWADLGDGKHGFSLINNSKYGYDCAGNVLRLSLLRSPTWPDPDADRGPQHFEYALYPHAGRWQDADTVHIGYEFNNPLVAEQVPAHDGTLPLEKSFAGTDAPNVILSAMKRSEDGKALIVRLYEDAGKQTHTTVHLPVKQGPIAEANLMEAVDSSAKPLTLNDGAVEIDIAPWEIKTLRIEVPQRSADFWR